MAKLSKEEQRRIVERELPGYELVERRTRGAAGDSAEADARQTAPAEARSPDIDALRRKYLGDEAARSDVRRTAEPSARGERAAPPAARRGSRAGATEAAADAAEDADEAEDTVATVHPENAFDPAIGAPGDKKVVLGGKDKRIIARQG